MRKQLLSSRPARVRLLVALVTVVAVALSPLALVVSSAEAAHNKRPQLRQIGTQTVHAGHLLTVRPHATDPDHGPRNLRFSASGRPSWLKLNTRTGVMTGRPAARLTNEHWRVTLRVSDGRATQSRAFTVRVRPNAAPQLAAISNRNVVEGDELLVTPDAIDPDNGPKALRYSVTYGGQGEPAWIDLDRRTGYLTGTAPDDARGDRWTVTLSVTDGQKTARRSFTLRVIAPVSTNRAPEVDDQTFSVDEGMSGTEAGRVLGSDPDNDPLTWSLTELNQPFAITAGGRITTVEALDYEKKDSYDLTVRASDGRDHTDATITVDVKNIDESPVIGELDDVTTDEDAELTPITVTATDPEKQDVTVAVTGLPAGLDFDAATGEISGTPTVPGTSTVTVTADDGTSRLAAKAFRIKVTGVNHAPVIHDQSFSVEEGSQPGADVDTLTATDEDGDELTFSSDSQDFTVAKDGAITVADADLSNGAGPYTFQVTVTDPDGRSDTASVTITVVDVDQAPKFTGTPYAFGVKENSAATTAVGAVSATDPDGDSIGYAITGGNTGGAFAIDAATGAITVAGALDHETTDSYELTVQATAGDESDEATVSVSVEDVNEAPSIGQIADQDATEDAAIDPIDVEVTDPDEGDTATVTVTGLPAGVEYADGRITGTPTVPDTYEVTITATDQRGLAGTTTFTLTVANVNDAPVITPVDDQSATEDEAIDPIVVTATDEDGDDLTLDVSALPAGLTWDAGSGTISGTPTEAGDYSIDVTANDGNGGTASDTFVISVANVNDAPVIDSIDPTSISGTVGESLSVDVTVVATDEDGDDLELGATDLPDGLSATDNGDGTVTISGTPTAAGDSTATISATDPDDASDTADLAISIAAEVTTCAPISTLPCADVPVDLPYSLSFDGTEDGLADTGFTMVDPPSHRDDTDQAPAPTSPSNPDVPGYEPSLLEVAGGQLSITATKGIMYSFPEGTGSSTETNSQLNALGVGVTGSEGGYEVDTTLASPTFPGTGNSSQQGGVWWGLGEDDFVKAAVVRSTATTNKVQLVTEVGGVATPATIHELNSADFPAGQDVRLVLRAEDTPGDGGVVSLQYAVNGANLGQLTDVKNTVDTEALPVPQSFFDGAQLADDAGQSSFAGVFTTKRRAAAADDIEVSFANFEVREVAAPDTTAPAAPTGVEATAGTGSVDLTWDANDEGDLAGYRVFRSTSTAVDTDGTPISGEEPITGTSYTDTTAVGGTTYHYVVVAVDQSGNASEPSTEVSATPEASPEVHEKYVFQPAAPVAGQETPAGYTKNDGSAWTDASGIGWVTQASLSQASHQPLDLTKNTRYRTDTKANGYTPLQRSIIHLQYGDVLPVGTNGNATAGAFELAVPDGWYQVKASVGDEAGGAKTGCPAPCYDSLHSIEIEGVQAIDRFQATAATEFRSATETVEVTDGRLTVDAIGGTNTKLNYLEVDSTDAPDTTAPMHEKYVFQPATPTAGQSTPAGYTKNDGSAWTDASGIGWVTQASLAQASHEPLDLTKNTRYRNRAGVSVLQNSIIHLQYGDIVPPSTNGNSTAGAFERAVPDGWYQVTASVGDQKGSTAYDSQHTINVEGVTAIDRFQATATSEYRSATVTVHVTDGRLTVDAIGGTNTKLNYLELDSTTAPSEADVHQKVRFSDEASTPPAGYVEDFGQAYGERTGAEQGSGLTYGWRALSDSAPLSLVGNGRNRLTTTPAAPAGTTPLQAGLLHMQLPQNATQGVKTPGYWEMAVPNGAYTVSVSAGDATAVDSDHWLNVEDQNAIAHFVPSGADGAATHWAEATRTVTVSDGRLTITPTGGTNTKINWVTIDSVAGAAARPSIRTPHPANLATGVDPATTSVVNDLTLPNGGVEGASLDSRSVRLTRVSDGAQIPSGAATSGGSDTINLSPTVALDPNTLYRFELTSDATDITGAHFLPYSLVFTTGAGASTGGPVAFDKSDSGAAKGAMYTSLVKGPDGKMYAGSITGQIYRFDIAGDGSLTNRQTITTVQGYSSAHDTYHPGMRTVIGMAFDPASTATNPILWITDDAPFLGTQDVPQFSGRLARLSGANLQDYQAILTGLPRSVKDHETNSAAFGPDGALYFNQGADNAMGRADGTWRNRPETVLTAAVLRLDPADLPGTAQLPVDVQTQSFDSAKGDVGTTTNGTPKNSGPYYDPYAADAPLTIYAMGTRNAFDLVWHSNGHLYTPTNGSAAGGNTPAVPSPLPASCAKRPDGGYTGGPAPAITGNPDAETDYVFDIKKGGYYGHPNAERCEYVLAGGNPTSGKDPFEVPSYPVGTRPDPRMNLADMYDAGLHASANGAIEYKGGAFGGALNGKLLYVRYSSGQDVVSFDVDQSTGRLSNRTSIISGLAQPLDIAEDSATGNIYVSQLTDNGANTSIALLKPRGGGGGPVATATDRLVLSSQSGATSRTRGAVIENSGVDDVEVTGATLGGTNANQFRLPATPSLPVTLAAGETLTIPVAFAPSSTGVKSATLDVATGAGPRSVRLRGLAAAGLGGSSEPSLQQIMDTYEIPVNVGDSTSSSSSPIGDEVRAQLFEKAADDSPISITPIAAYGPQNSDPAIKVGWYEPGNGAALHQQFTVKAADAQGLMVDPVGTTTNIDPGGGAFGFYSDWPYFGDQKPFTEDALNTWDAAHPHHVRVYPLKNADGSVEPNAYILATEEVPGSTFDTQDLVLVVRNVKPTVPAAPNARVALQNLDGVPYDDRLAFSRIQSPNTSTSTTQRTHDTAQLKVTNSGTQAMQVTGLPVSGPFELVGAPSLPLTVAAGGSTTLTVKFNATSGAVHNGSLQVVTNAGTNGTPTVQLSGFWQSQSENGQEPSVREMTQVFGFGTNIPANLNADGAVVAVGDEVLSPYWKAVNAAQPVTVRQLAAFHTFPNQATAFWHSKGTNTTSKITDINTAWAQSILPPKSGSTTAPAAASFSPPGTFGFKIDSEWSDDTKNSKDADHTNGCVDPCGHHMRFFPVKDRSGATVAGSYLMMMDYSGINYDYNDNVYVVSNIKPEVPSVPRDVAASAGDGRVTLTWSTAAESGVQYNVWRGTSPTVATTGPPLNPAPLSTPSYVDTAATNGTTYYYVVKAVYPGGASSAASAAVAAVPVSASAYQLKVNFQTKAGAVPGGYVKDFGSPYATRTDAGQGTGNAYGWVVPGTHTGLDLSVGGTGNLGNGRVRGVDADPRTDSFMHMQGDDVPNFSGTPAEGAWEVAVPDGSYTVTLVVGDAKVGSDPESHEVNVEGQNAVHAFVPSGGDGSPTRHASRTLTVDVTDGRLTVDALGGTNTKLDYVDIVGVG